MAAVTAGLPVYNGAQYLDRALASLCAQTFQDFSILIADNASTDNTPQIIESWARRDGRIRVHRQSSNIGALANFEWVLLHSNSPWFMFAAHDDEWSPNYIESLYRAITARPQLAIAVPQLVTFRETPDRPHKAKRYPERINSLALAPRIRLALRRSRPGWFYSLFERERLLAATVQARALNQIWAGDILSLLHVLLSGAITGSNQAIYYRRLTPASADLYGPKIARERYQLYRRWLQLAFAALAAAPLTRSERLMTVPALLHYARYVGKPVSILKAALRELWR